MRHRAASKEEATTQQQDRLAKRQRLVVADKLSINIDRVVSLERNRDLKPPRRTIVPGKGVKASLVINAVKAAGGAAKRLP